MFQKIATIYYNIKNKETNNSAILLKAWQTFTNIQKIYTRKYYSQGNTEDLPPLHEMMNIPYDLNEIQPRAIKVWN